MPVQITRRIGTPVTTSGALTAGQHTPADATTGNITLTLPTAPAAGAHLSIEKTDRTNNTVTITGTIRGVASSTIVLPWRNESIELIADNASSWWPVASHKTRTALDVAYTTARNSADLRFIGLPTVMATPPTITITNDRSGATTLAANGPAQAGTSYTNIVATDTTKYTPLNVGTTQPVVGTGGGLANYAVGWTIGASCPQVVAIETIYDGVGIEFMCKQFAGTQFHVMVDGQWATSYPQTFGGTAGSWGNIKLVFATAAIRRIRLEFTGNGTIFGGIWKAPTDTIRATIIPNRRLAILGDSYTGGANSTAVGSWGTYAAHAMGFRDYVNAGLGGSGWIQTTTVNGTAYNAANRLTGDIINQAPTDVIIALGHNDTASTTTAVAAQVTTVLQTIRSSLPALKSLTVVGPLWNSENPAIYGAYNTAMKAASVGLVDAYIDTVANPPFIGTGRVGATTGVGNADTYIGSDGVHPTDAGSQWLGAALAYAITDALN